MGLGMGTELRRNEGGKEWGGWGNRTRGNRLKFDQFRLQKEIDRNWFTK